MSFMHAYGPCDTCGEEGALWRRVIGHRPRWFFFGSIVPRIRYTCDECG